MHSIKQVLGRRRSSPPPTSSDPSSPRAGNSRKPRYVGSLKFHPSTDRQDSDGRTISNHTEENESPQVDGVDRENVFHANGEAPAPFVSAPLTKHPRTTLERVEKFIDDSFYKSTNLYGKLYEQSIKIPALAVQHYDAGDERLPYEEVTKLRSKFKPLVDGQRFGPTWSTHWFVIKLQPAALPDNWFGREVHLIWNSGCEAMVYRNGQPVQGLSPRVRESCILTPKLQRGELVDEVWVEMACNDLFGAGKDGDMIGAPDEEKFFQLDTFRMGVFRRPVYEVLRALTMLVQMAKLLDEKSQQHWDAMYLANHVVNLLCYDPASTNALDEARALIKRFFSTSSDQAKPNATYAGRCEVIAIGNCHIDTAWLWPYAETRRKCARSWVSTLTLMDQYPHFTFALSQMQQLHWLKQGYPSIYSRIQQHVKDGRFLLVGGTWVEMDGYMPDGESFCRQFLFGQRFLEQEFGRRATVFWLPDTFGYSPQLPQLIRLAGIKYFITQKMSWSLVNKFPHTSFIWRGIDGSEVLTHFPPADTYTAKLDVEHVLKSVEQNKDKGRVSKMLLLYGEGDGGGGPTQNDCEQARLLRDCRALPARVTTAGATPDRFFEHLEDRRENLCTWSGELYLELHNGTYTSQATTKQLNRMCERNMHDLELLASIAMLENREKYPIALIDKLWRDTLLNQFHDVLPGSSIGRVHRESESMLKAVHIKSERELRRFYTIMFSKQENNNAAVSTSRHGSPLPIRAASGPSASAINNNNAEQTTRTVTFAAESTTTTTNTDTLSHPANLLLNHSGISTLSAGSTVDGSQPLLTGEEPPLSSSLPPSPLLISTSGNVGNASQAQQQQKAENKPAGRGVLFWNSTSYDRTEVVRLPYRLLPSEFTPIFSAGNDSSQKNLTESKTAEHHQQQPLVQISNECAYFVVTVPAVGYTLYHGTNGQTIGAHDAAVPQPVRAYKLDSGLIVLENAYLKASIDKYGRIVSLLSKQVLSRDPRTGAERIRMHEAIRHGGYGNQMMMHHDTPLYWEAWDVMDYHLETTRPLVAVRRAAEIGDTGPLSASVIVSLDLTDPAAVAEAALQKKKQNSATPVEETGPPCISYLEQNIILTACTKFLTFDTTICWNETHRMLKMQVDTSILSENRHATFDMQFGHIERPHTRNTSWEWAKYEVCAHKWMDLAEHGFGVAVLNDSKYGCSVRGGEMSLSLLRSPKRPDPECDMGMHQFIYGIMPHFGDFQGAGVIREAQCFNRALRGVLPASPLRDAASGLYIAQRSWFRLVSDNDAVVLATVKRAERFANAVVVRMYESYGGQNEAWVVCTLFSAAAAAGSLKIYECNVMEDEYENGNIEYQPYQAGPDDAALVLVKPSMTSSASAASSSSSVSVNGGLVQIADALTKKLAAAGARGGEFQFHVVLHPFQIRTFLIRG